VSELEKQLKKVSHQLELNKTKNRKEISNLNSRLQKKNNELAEQMENFIMNKLDLDAYNLTSDDLRSSGSRSKSQNVRQSDSKTKSGVSGKIHPLVPKLNFQKIFDWREKANNDNVIMIRISESRIIGESEVTEEINDEDGVDKSSKKYFSKGYTGDMTSARVNELFERKQSIINALNQVYTDDEDSDVTPEMGYETN